MAYRILKNGRHYTFGQTHEVDERWVDPSALGREDVYGMDITPVEEEWLLRSMDDLDEMGAPHLTWTLGADKWRLERIS
jgi:hypothetical protein